MNYQRTIKCRRRGRETAPFFVFMGGYKMGHCFSHLTITDRYKLEAALLAKEKPQAIADKLHVHVSTIYREKNRARMVQLTSELVEIDRYNPDEAHRRYRENLSKKGADLKIGNDRALADYLEKKVAEDGYSPAAALASIELEGLEFSVTICTGTFYNYIEKGVFLRLTSADLPEKPKRKRPYHKVRAVKRPSAGDSIEKRPPGVDARKIVGDWEMDTIYSSRKGKKNVLLVLTERKTRTPIMELMPDRTLESTAAALDRIERRFGSRLFRKIFRTITVDNGGEFADAERLEQSALTKGKRTKIYYCHPYCSYERGSNENENKMIRRHFPKGTDFGKVTAAQVKRVERWIANYPRKILGWKTSAIMFEAFLDTL